MTFILCCKAANHYLSQRWPRSMPPYNVIRPQWVNLCYAEFISWSVNISLQPVNAGTCSLIRGFNEVCFMVICRLWSWEKIKRNMKAIQQLTNTNTYNAYNNKCVAIHNLIHHSIHSLMAETVEILPCERPGLVISSHVVDPFYPGIFSFRNLIQYKDVVLPV